MGRDMHAYLEHFNSQTEKWEAVQLFILNKDEQGSSFKEVPFIGGGWGNYGILCGDDLSEMPDFFGCRTIPVSTLSDEVKKHYDNLFEADGALKIGYFGLSCVNVADILIYTLEHPTIKDYDADWSDEAYSNPSLVPRKENPLKSIIERVEFFAEITDILFYESLSEFRIICWGDC